MISYTTHDDRTRFRLTYGFLIIILTIAVDCFHSVYGAEFESLDEAALLNLGKNLTAMEKLAPQLHTQLRNVRTTMEFYVREINNIERSLEKAQSDIEHLIVMHNTDRVNPTRALFFVNDLRRKAATLDQGLSHMTQQIAKKSAKSEEGKGQHNVYSEGNSQLLSLLQDYNRLVNQSLKLLSGEI